mmetsp:Transcript_54149/g.85773  ORF Transcript_54149/g.85773 Transcript_54149/m.85773 type:complete len:130 (-) Transcript_54149:55-444(-)
MPSAISWCVVLLAFVLPVTSHRVKIKKVNEEGEASAISKQMNSTEVCKYGCTCGWRTIKASLVQLSTIHKCACECCSTKITCNQDETLCTWDNKNKLGFDFFGLMGTYCRDIVTGNAKNFFNAVKNALK